MDIETIKKRAADAPTEARKRIENVAKQYAKVRVDAQTALVSADAKDKPTLQGRIKNAENRLATCQQVLDGAAERRKKADERRAQRKAEGDKIAEQVRASSAEHAKEIAERVTELQDKKAEAEDKVKSIFKGKPVAPVEPLASPVEEVVSVED